MSLIEVFPSKAVGAATAPPSKSMEHRLLICAALSGGVSCVENLSHSDDILATKDCLRALGVTIEEMNNGCRVFGGLANDKNAKLYCRESGSTLRFFIPICLALGGNFTLFGSTRLMQRPLSEYVGICKEQGIVFEQSSESVSISGKLKSGVFHLRGDVSSQFITGLLFALPLLESDSKIVLTTKVESRSYLDLTFSALKTFGVAAGFVSENEIFVRGSQRYQATDAFVEGDHSNAAFLGAFNALGGSVVVQGLDEKSLQGDRVWQRHVYALKDGFQTISLADCPDLGPVLMAVAAANHGAKFTDTARLKIKESDRGAAMKAELEKFGVQVEENENEILVSSSPLKTPSQTLCSHNDHRIAMSLFLLCSITGGVLDGAEAITKSYPDFYDVCKGLGVKWTLKG